MFVPYVKQKGEINVDKKEQSLITQQFPAALSDM